jgi:hypothetical protein
MGGRRAMVSIDTERKVAERSLTAIGLLTVSPPSTIEDVIEALRQAWRVAASTHSTFPPQTALNNARGEVAMTLPPLIRAIENWALKQRVIDNARRAVEEWNAELKET